MRPNKTLGYECVVCGTATEFFHLKAKICRACASFMRRSINESIEYTCAFSGKCKIDSTRHNCRKCRWERCRAAGAQLQVSVLPVPPKEEPLLCLSLQPRSSRVVPLLKLEHLMRGYDEFLAAQRALIVDLHPELAGIDQQLLRVKKSFLASMEQKSLPFLLRFYNDHCGPFSKLGKQQKIDLVMKSYLEFGIFHKAFLTSRFFPQVDDERLAIFNGYFGMFDFGRHGAEVCQPHWFFEGFVEDEKIDTYVSVITPMMSRLYRQVKRFKAQGFRQFDVCVVLFLMVCKHRKLPSDTTH
ncbi:Nuclear receptor [Aphelenchoides fujianensis]|nr:Nuclear receptor [Aphelenchoides fujianensis]